MGALAWVFAIIGAVIGVNARDEFAGLLVGGVAGFCFGWLFRIAHRLRHLERQVKLLEQQLTESAGAQAVTASRPPREPFAQQRPEPVTAPPLTSPITRTEEPSMTTTATAASEQTVQVEWSQLTPASGLTPVIEWLRRFFTDGNVVVRVGIIVLFFGVAFLLKFAIDRQLLPIELRLTASALGGIGLIGLGWHLRDRRTSYALLVQGGGIGIFYLTVFAAAKLYDKLPLGLALLLMVAVVALSSLLALWQNSRALAAFGIAGGFLAPVLTSSGGGNHVLLFSYYALLNSGILGIAWYRAWRELNLLGFLFTFVIGTSWGVSHYQSALFASTEPFLILFFLFYVAIAVLFALRQPLQLRGYVDGTLVFGVPIVGFALQTGLVHNFEYGTAISAFVMGGLYISLASLLWRRQIEGMRLLTESFLALGVVFATLAIPLALDGRWTAAAWALEGGALLWIGVKQGRLLSRLTGLLLQLGAGLFFLLDLYSPFGGLPILNSIFLGATLISFAALFGGWQLHHHRDALRRFERVFEYLLLVWGVIWWLGFGAREIDHHLLYGYHFNATLLFLVLTAAALLAVWRLGRWPTLRYPLLGLLPMAVLLSLDIFYGYRDHFLASWGVVPWALLFVVQYRLLWRIEGVMGQRLIEFGHAVTLWFLLALLGHELAWGARELLNVGLVWQAVAWTVLPLLTIVMLGNGHWRPAWPVERFAASYRITALLPVALALLVWSLAMLRSDGNPWPLPFIPLINPLELMQLSILLVVFSWWWSHRDDAVMRQWLPDQRAVLLLLGLLLFIWLNGVVAHAVHHLGGVAYTTQALFHSVKFQMALSVSWSVVALLITVLATRWRLRPLWMAGALLLALVVVKLFFIDLARSGSVERIISFIVAGALMLVIGYFSPLPPKREEKES